MNKTILIAGGAAVASLAVGTAGGYFFAKQRFEKIRKEEVDRELAAAKKHYSLLLMQAQKPEDPKDLVISEDGEGGPDLEGISESDQKALAAGLAKIRSNKLANNKSTEVPEKVDYNKISTTATKTTKKAVPKKNAPAKRTQSRYPLADPGEANDDGLYTHNIFTDEPRDTARVIKKAVPPRDEATGSFRARTQREKDFEPPQIISVEDYLLNDLEYNQESLYYFVHDKTLVLQADPTEAIDRAVIGEVNLTLFPEVEEGHESRIYVCNDGLSTYYEVKKMEESLTEFLGLGTETDGDEDDGAAYL